MGKALALLRKHRRAAPAAPTGPALAPLISRGLPTFDSGGFGGTLASSCAVDADYSTSWRVVNVPSGGSPQYWDLDLSGIADVAKTSVVFHWFNDATLNFWDGVSAQTSANFNTLMRDYTIDAHTAAGGGSPPAIGDGGWTNLVTATGNVYRSRQYALNLSGKNWVRFRITAANGAAGNDDVTAQVNIHNVAAGNQDNLIFLGDSITSECMTWRNLDGSPWTNGPLTKQIETALAGRYPIYMNGGVPTTLIAYGDTNKATLLAGFTGKYVSISWGANDASGATTANAYYTSLLSIVDYVLGLGKIPIVPKITQRQGNAPADALVVAYNAKIDQLATDRPTALIGPDMYAKVNDGTILLRDGLHPTFSGAGNGYEAMQGVWASWLTTHLYS